MRFFIIFLIIFSITLLVIALIIIFIVNKAIILLNKAITSSLFISLFNITLLSFLLL